MHSPDWLAPETDSDTEMQGSDKEQDGCDDKKGCSDQEARKKEEL